MIKNANVCQELISQKRKKKKICYLEDFAVSEDHGVKIKESEIKTCQWTKKTLRRKADGDINFYWSTWNSSQRLRKGNWKR